MLKVDGLKVVVGKNTILNNVNLSVGQGEVVALIGSNGAGKSTLAAALVGIYKTKEGTVCVNDKPINKMKFDIGFIPQHPSFMDNVKVRELLKLYSSFYGQPLADEELIQLGLLKDMLHKKTQELSGGEKKRLAFALAMIGRPKLLIADEPTSGMDSEMRNYFYGKLQCFVKKGLAVLLVTHWREELENLAHRVVSLENGELVDKTKPNILEGVIGR